MSENITLSTEQLQQIIDEAVSKALARYIKEKPKEAKRNYLTIREFAAYFSMHKPSINNLIKEGKIYAFQAYGTTAWRIPKSEIEEYEKKSRKKTKNDIFTRNF